MTQKIEETFKKEMTILFKEGVIDSELVFQVVDIQKDLNEYCLNVTFGFGYEVLGFYVKDDNNLSIDCILSHCRLVLKKNDYDIKIYIEDYQWSKKESKEKFNIEKDNIISFFKSLKLIKEQNIEEALFLITEVSKTLKVKNIITLDEYIIDLTHLKEIKKFKSNDFIYIKHFSITKGIIELNNLSFIQKANDFQIFKMIEKQIEIFNDLPKNNDFYEFKPIKKNDSIDLDYLFTKVVLKNNADNFIILLDKFNRLIRYYIKQDDNINLFDLILITNCKIISSSKKIFEYELKLKDNSLFYVSKELIFNKEIVINNYTILDIAFPDFKTENYFNKLIFCEKEVSITKNNQIFLFKFNNDQFNEIVPFNISFKKRKYTFKFLITHNLLNKINIFINYTNVKTCAIDYCFYNIHDNHNIPDLLSFKVESTRYLIAHSNNFDSSNRISFILLNIPRNKNVEKIKNKTGVISAQIWFTASKENDNNSIYDIYQIFDVDEAKPNIYREYEQNLEPLMIFKDFYFDLMKYYETWENDESMILNYYNNFSKKVELVKDNIESIKKFYNIEYYPDSASHNFFLIYANIILFEAFQKLKKYKDKYGDTIPEWKQFLSRYSSFLKQISDIKYKLTSHQKIRLCDTYYTYYFIIKNGQIRTTIPCKFWNIKDYDNEPNSSYVLALSFYKEIIKNLTENSALTIGYLQLDSYILTNYFIKNPMKCYSLSNEPLVLMKHHLLCSYDEFLLIYCLPCHKKKPKINAIFDKKNRVTLINEIVLFDSYDSETFIGKDFAFPISMEFFLEKDSHSKKNLKNQKIKIPIVAFSKAHNLSKKLSESEDGNYIESLIGSIEFINKLKDCENHFAELMDIKYFIDKNFELLHKKYNELSKKTSNFSGNINESQNIKLDSKEYKFDKHKNPDELVTLKDYEDYYLHNGAFAYPGSLPWYTYPVNTEPPKRPDGEIQFLKKYAKEIEFGRKFHLGEEIEDE